MKHFEEDIKKIRATAAYVVWRQKMLGYTFVPLSNEETFAMKFVMGARINYSEGMATTEPCGIAWTGKKFLLVTEQRLLEGVTK